MKDQYFGDLNDYRKYGLLRALAAGDSLKIGVCWMLTPPDGRRDGSRLRYFEQPERFRAHDPLLFDALRESVKVRRVRRVAEIERAWSAGVLTRSSLAQPETQGARQRRSLGQPVAGEDTRAPLLPGASFYPEVVPDGAISRAVWCQRMLGHLRDADLIFFDPDNGLEVPSKPWGRNESSKYLFWREVEAAWSRSHSLLIYQHFPRVDRGRYTARLVREVSRRLRPAQVFAFRTSSVLFLLAAQARHVCPLHQRAAILRKRWQNQIDVA